jgi:DHA1 family multidrug resistance protein-like MFS transporter
MRMTPVVFAETSDTVAARGQLRQLCAAGFLAYCSYAMCRSPLLPLFARDLGADARLVGLVVGASTLTGVVLKLPAGAWSDVLGRRALLVAGALVFAITPFTYVPVSGLGLLIALRVLHGSATAIFGPVASASLSDIAPANRRATWLSTYSTCQGAGQALGPVLAGYLIAVGRFDTAFVLAGLIALLTPLIVARWPSTRRDAPSLHPSPSRQFVQGIREVIRERRILLTSLAQSAQFVLNGTLTAFLPLYAGEIVGLSAAEIGWLFGLQTITTLATRPIIGIASDRIGRRGVIVAGLVVCSMAVWIISMAETRGSLFGAVLAYAAGVAVTTAATSAYITDMAPRTRYGAAHGVFGTIYDVGDAGGPIVAGVLVAAWGYAYMFQTMATAALAMAVAFYLLSRSPHRPAPTACVIGI